MQTIIWAANMGCQLSEYTEGRPQENDTLLIESDLISYDGMFSVLTEIPYPNLALVAKYEAWMESII